MRYGDDSSYKFPAWLLTAIGRPELIGRESDVQKAAKMTRFIASPCRLHPAQRAKVFAMALWFASLLAAATPATAQAPAAPGTSMEYLPSLMNQGKGGTFRCPDGTNRTYEGGAPSDLFKSMKCSGPAKSANGPSPAEQAMAAKNDKLVLEGRSGVRAGLEATVKTGSPDYLLQSPLVWVIGGVAALAAIAVTRRR